MAKNADERGGQARQQQKERSRSPQRRVGRQTGLKTRRQERHRRRKQREEEQSGGENVEIARHNWENGDWSSVPVEILISAGLHELLEEFFVNLLYFERFFHSASDVVPNHKAR